MEGVLAREALKKANNATAAIPMGMNFTKVLLLASAASARSRFQPQRGQKGLFVMLKKRRSGTGEPQRGHVMVRIETV